MRARLFGSQPCRSRWVRSANGLAFRCPTAALIRGLRDPQTLGCRPGTPAGRVDDGSGQRAVPRSGVRQSVVMLQPGGLVVGHDRDHLIIAKTVALTCCPHRTHPPATHSQPGQHRTARAPAPDGRHRRHRRPTAHPRTTRTNSTTGSGGCGVTGERRREDAAVDAGQPLPGACSRDPDVQRSDFRQANDHIRMYRRRSANPGPALDPTQTK